MKFWALVGLFTVVTAPSAFALESLIDAPPEPRDFMIAHVEPLAPAPIDAVKRAAGKQHGAPMQSAQERSQPSRQRTAETAEPEQQRRRPREEPRRRRSGSVDRVPDSVLIGGRGAL
jgi:hypothetical protein